MRRYLIVSAFVFLGVLAAVEVPRISAAPADPVQQITAGWGHTCALVGSGDVYCWGAAEVNGSDHDSTFPLLVRGLTKVKHISAGLGESCAIDLTDRAWCWGTDWQETIARKSLVRSHVPKPVEELPAVTQISIGYSHLCSIVKTNGSVWCRGSNGAGELGNGSTVETLKPVRAGMITQATSISVGVANSCAAAGGEVYCWGADSQRGGGVIVKSRTPAKIDGLKNVTKVVNGRNFFCSLNTAGAVICFGSNIFNQLGNKAAGKRYSTPVKSNVSAATDIAANVFSACGVLASKKVSCWGAPFPAKGTSNEGIEPTEIVALDDVKSVALGVSHACALQYSGRIKCWGNNESGYLGNGQTSNVPVIRPIEVIGLP
jgi:alpha-tubulin suppressor-like RCC1 family protein